MVWLMVIFLENGGSNSYSSNLVVEKFKTAESCLLAIEVVKKTVESANSGMTVTKSSCTRAHE